MKIRPLGTELFHADRQTYRQMDRHFGANNPFFAILRTHRKLSNFFFREVTAACLVYRSRHTKPLARTQIFVMLKQAFLAVSIHYYYYYYYSLKKVNSSCSSQYQTSAAVPLLLHVSSTFFPTQRTPLNVSISRICHLTCLSRSLI